MTLHPVVPSALTPEERRAFLATMRAEEVPACEGGGGRLLDDWGYERGLRGVPWDRLRGAP